MSFEGTYEELLEFLRLADDLVRLMTVNNVAYEVAEEGTTAAPDVEQSLTVEIDAEVYYQPTDVPEGTAPAAPAAPETSPETTTAAPAAE
jgi:Tfp pilus assembly protein PilO